MTFKTAFNQITSTEWQNILNISSHDTSYAQAMKAATTTQEKVTAQKINNIKVHYGIYKNPVYNFCSAIIVLPMSALGLGFHVIVFALAAIPVACSEKRGEIFGKMAAHATLTAEKIVASAANLITLGCAGAGFRYYHESHKD